MKKRKKAKAGQLSHLALIQIFSNMKWQKNRRSVATAFMSVLGKIRMSNASRMLISAAMALFIAAPAQALYIVNIEQFGNDVTATGSGSLPTIGSHMTVFDGSTAYPGISTDGESVIIGRPGPGHFRVFFTGESTRPLGIGDVSTKPDYSFGPIVGLTYWGPGSLGMIVPEDYVWGSELGLSLSTWFDTTLHGMGLTAGTVSYMLGFNQTEVFRVNIIGPETPHEVPAPSTLALLVIGLAGMGFRFLSLKKSR